LHSVENQLAVAKFVDLPNYAAESMGDGPDGGLIAQASQQAPEHQLKVAAFLFDGRVRRLV
jgi:hypothetical protein